MDKPCAEYIEENKIFYYSSDYITYSWFFNINVGYNYLTLNQTVEVYKGSFLFLGTLWNAQVAYSNQSDLQFTDYDWTHMVDYFSIYKVNSFLKRSFMLNAKISTEFYTDSVKINDSFPITYQTNITTKFSNSIQVYQRQFVIPNSIRYRF